MILRRTIIALLRCTANAAECKGKQITCEPIDPVILTRLGGTLCNGHQRGCRCDCEPRWSMNPPHLQSSEWEGHAPMIT